MPNTATQLARTAYILIDYAVEQGMNREKLMQVAGLARQEVVDPDSRLRTASMLKLWREVIGGLNDPILGLRVGMTVRCLDLGLVGYTMHHSRNFFSALSRLSRYGRVLSDAITFKVARTSEGAVVVWEGQPELEALRHPVETAVAMVVSVSRDLTGTDLAPKSVSLMSPIPPSAGDYRSRFHCPVAFGGTRASVTFSSSQLQLPTRAPDPMLLKYLDDLAVITLGPLEDRESSTVAEVRRTLWSALPGGRPNLWRTAAEMGISPRTLQRRLGEEQSSFSTVLDELRRDLSDELLSDRQLSVAQVAFLLGYSEPSAFQRAYRRWRGVSPRRYRSA
ncbi:MAG: AraC family transcriptional regulator [Woeseiaceae bacterium]